MRSQYNEGRSKLWIHVDASVHVSRALQDVQQLHHVFAVGRSRRRLARVQVEQYSERSKLPRVEYQYCIVKILYPEAACVNFYSNIVTGVRGYTFWILLAQ